MLRLASWIVVAGLFTGAECRAQVVYAPPPVSYGVAPTRQELGQPTSIDLKEATLGQVVDALTSSGSPTDKEGVKPINVLISDQLREIPVGTIKLNNVYPRAALEGICKLTDGVFLIEEVADGQVLILKELKKPIVVRAIKLQRPSLSPPNVGAMMSMLSGGGAEKSEEALQDEAKALEVRYEMQIKQTLESVEVAFDLYEKESGTHLSRPKLQIQDQLMMVIAVGTEESVAIAAEIIEASMGGGSSNRRMGGGMGMGGMGGDMMMGGSMGSGMMGGSGFGSGMSGAGSAGADPNRPAPQKR
jgi:hypothetical protein